MDTIRVFFSKIRALFFRFLKKGRGGLPPLPPSPLVARLYIDRFFEEWSLNVKVRIADFTPIYVASLFFYDHFRMLRILCSVPYPFVEEYLWWSYEIPAFVFFFLWKDLHNLFTNAVPSLPSLVELHTLCNSPGFCSDLIFDLWEKWNWIIPASIAWTAYESRPVNSVKFKTIYLRFWFKVNLLYFFFFFELYDSVSLFKETNSFPLYLPVISLLTLFNVDYKTLAAYALIKIGYPLP